MKRILFISKSPPYPPSMGGNQRANLLYKALSKIGQVDLLLASDANDLLVGHPAWFREFNVIDVLPLLQIGEQGAWKLLRKMNSGLIDRLAHHLHGIHWMYQSDARLHERVVSIYKRMGYDMIVGCPVEVLARTGSFDMGLVILDNHDLTTAYYRSRLDINDTSFLRRGLLARHLRQLEECLPPLFRRCHAVFIADEDDRSYPGLEQAVLLPNIPFNIDFQHVDCRSLNESKTIATVAAYSHKPNVDAVDYFIGKVWPGIYQTMLSATYRIVGSGIDDSLRHRWERVPGVRVVGYVHDLADEYRKAAFTVVPIQWGAGTNIKVIETLAYGRTCVITPCAHRGYRQTLRHGDCLLVASDVESFRQECLTLLRNPDVRNKLAFAGHDIIRKEYSFERFCKIVKDTIESRIG